MTDADDGKILTVDDGEWTAVMPDRIKIEASFDGDNCVLPMTFNEIFSSLNQKKEIIILMPPDGEDTSWTIAAAAFAFKNEGAYVIAIGVSSMSLVTGNPDSNTFTVN